MSKRKKNRAASKSGAPPVPAAQPAVPTASPLTAGSPAALAWPLIALLVGLFLATRLINLSVTALHGDEATYIYWGQIAASGPEERFISMWGGRQPLHTWIVAALVPLVDSILVPARLISVALRSGVDPEVVVKHLRGIRCPNPKRGWDWLTWGSGVGDPTARAAWGQAIEVLEQDQKTATLAAEMRRAWGER